MGHGRQNAHLTELSAQFDGSFFLRSDAPTPDHIRMLEDLHVFFGIRIADVAGILGAPLCHGEVGSFQMQSQESGTFRID